MMNEDEFNNMYGEDDIVKAQMEIAADVMAPMFRALRRKGLTINEAAAITASVSTQMINSNPDPEQQKEDSDDG